MATISWGDRGSRPFRKEAVFQEVQVVGRCYKSKDGFKHQDGFSNDNKPGKPMGAGKAKKKAKKKPATLTGAVGQVPAAHPGSVSGKRPLISWLQFPLGL